MFNRVYFRIMIKPYDNQDQQMRERERWGLMKADYKFWQDIYPITIVQDRYGGTYSGAAFLCFGCEFYEIPEEVNGDDIESITFWDITNLKTYHADLHIGKGETPDAALRDYVEKYYNT